MNYNIQQLYNELNEELLNSNINDICNICKLPTKKYERITLNCGHFYHINCINISNRTLQYICPYCSKRNKIEKNRCIFIKKKLKYSNDHLNFFEDELKKNVQHYYINKKKLKEKLNEEEYDLLNKNKDLFKIKINDLKKKINEIKDYLNNSNNQCKKCTISDSKYCNNHIKKIKQDIEKSKNNNILYNTTKRKLIENIKSLEILLNTNSELSHICNYKKKNDLLCTNKTKNNLIYCGIHMKKLKKDINDNNNKLKNEDELNLKLKKNIKELEEFLY